MNKILTRTIKHAGKLIKEEMKEMTYYEILGVPEKANRKQIRQSYLKLAKYYHPDLQDSPSEEFSYIVQAYQVLSDDHQRAIYDESLISEDDYYKVGAGKLKISIKWLFSLSLGGLLLLLSIREEDESCPTQHKISKVGIDEDIPISEETIAWTKTGSKKDKSIDIAKPNKPLYSKKQERAQEEEEEEVKQILKPSDRSFKSNK